MQRNIPLIIAIVLVFHGQACTNKERANNRTISVAIGAQPATLDPRTATDAYGTRIATLVFNSLVRVDKDLKIVGDAAKSWHEDGLSFEFQLHPNFIFSNGRPLNKDDIEFSFLQYTGKGSPYASGLELIESVKIKGSNEQGFTVNITLKEYSAKFLKSDLPTVKLLPKLEIQSGEAQFKALPFGTGSFSVTQQTPQKILLKKNPHHNLRPAKSDFIEFKVIKDDFTRFQKVLKGEVDIAQDEIPLDKIKLLKQQPDKFQLFQYPGLAFTYILINMRDAKLKNKKLRQAIAAALNRKQIIEYKLEGFGELATSIVTPSNPFFDASIKPFDFSPDLAKSLFKMAKRSFSPESNSLSLTLKTSSNPSAVDIAKVLKNQLAAIGIDLKIQSREWGTFYGDVKKGNFQLATMRWVGVIDPDIYRASLHSSETPPGRNRGYYSNQRLDKLLDEGLKAKNFKKRFAIYSEAQKIVLDELPIIPLWYNHQVAVVNRRISNFVPSMKGDYYHFIDLKKGNSKK